MARFLPYQEIVERAKMPVEDIHWLAGQIANLPAFVNGSAVLCGSVSWGEPSWRSDIDVAHFSTVDYPHIEQELEWVVQQYHNRTANAFIGPRIDVITIGAESITLVGKNNTISTSVSRKTVRKKGPVMDLFVETAILFADHIGSIAKLKGNPWKAFLEKYLSPVTGNQVDRRESIKDYVGGITTEWRQQPLHELNLDPSLNLTAKHLDLISKSENYPVNLMRRILGELGRYPGPDRAADVRGVFSALDEHWAQSLLAQFDSFFSLDRQYEEIVAACKDPHAPLSEQDYYERVRSMFINLPFIEIEKIIWEYVGE